MNVNEYAQASGVSARRVRARIHGGFLDADKVDGRWVLAELTPARGRRPLSTSSRNDLALALHRRSLAGLTGQARLRTAARIRALRESNVPAALLSDWWGAEMPAITNGGTALAAQGVRGNNVYIDRVLHRHLPEYLRDPRELGELVSSERAIKGLTRSQFARLANVDPRVLSSIERGDPGSSLGALRRVLRVADIEPSALPRISLS